MSSLKNLVSTLDYKPREILFKNLNQKERQTILQCLGGAQDAKTTEAAQKIFNKIEEAKNTPITISKRTDRRSIFTVLKKKAHKTLDAIAYFFGYLTARKTHSLASKYFNISKPSSNETEQSISANTLRHILSQERRANPKQTINLHDVLTKKGYSSVISNCTFDKAKIFLNVDLKDVSFENCDFEWCHFSRRTLSNVKFDGCRLANVSFLNATIETSTFHNSELQEVMFTGAKMDSSLFSLCSLIGNNFEDASIVDTTFRNSSLPATHFLEASTENSHFEQCDLKNTVFFGTFDHFSCDQTSKESAIVTKPITAMFVDQETRGITLPKVYMKLDQSANTIPLRISQKSAKTEIQDINKETETALTKIDSSTNDHSPIPQQLIQTIKQNPDEHKESIKILNKAEKLASEVDSFFLGGGEDVPPSLYGQEEEEETNWGNDYRRSILELGIIHQSFNKGIPLMGVCRGFQMANIYCGAQLSQDVKGHKGLQQFQLAHNNYQGLYYNSLKNPLQSAVFHHQAIPKDRGPTEHLDSSVIYQSLIKASEAKHSGASPMILLQFHPEFYRTNTAHNIKREWIDAGLKMTMSKQNESFWEILSDSAKAHRSKRTLLSAFKKKVVEKGLYKDEQPTKSPSLPKRIVHEEPRHEIQERLNRDLSVSDRIRLIVSQIPLLEFKHLIPQI